MLCYGHVSDSESIACVVCNPAQLTLAEYVENNRTEIDEQILGALPNLDPSEIDDDERENWVLNVESLYQDALEQGVTDI